MKKDSLESEENAQIIYAFTSRNDSSGRPGEIKFPLIGNCNTFYFKELDYRANDYIKNWVQTGQMSDYYKWRLIENKRFHER